MLVYNQVTVHRFVSHRVILRIEFLIKEKALTISLGWKVSLFLPASTSS